jgi:glycine cleavage system H protein
MSNQSKVPADLRYTKDHEWARREGELVRIGITDYAQEHLGDVVMVELPKLGQTLTAHKTFGTVESPKSVSDLFAPISGEVREVNQALDASPEKINADCYGDGWICAVVPSDAAELEALMSPADYEAFLAGLEQ